MRSSEFRKFFGDICDQARTFDELPKVIFGINLTDGMDGIIIEIKSVMLPVIKEIMENLELPTGDEQGPEEEGSLYFRNIVLDAGFINKSFVGETLSITRPYLNKKDFFFYYVPDELESPDNIPSFYAIPKLDILVQGYDDKMLLNYTFETIRKYSSLIEKRSSMFTREQVEIVAKIMRGQKPANIHRPN